MQNDGFAPTTHITDSRLRIRVESSDPSDGQVGDMYFNRLKNCLFVYTGSNWIGAPFND